MKATEKLRRIVWGPMSLKLTLSEKEKEEIRRVYEKNIKKSLLGDNPPEIFRIMNKRYVISRVEEGIMFRIRKKTLGPLRMAIPAGVDPKGKVEGWCELSGSNVRPDSLVLIKDVSVLFDGNKLIVFDPVGMVVIVNVETEEMRLVPFKSPGDMHSYMVFEEGEKRYSLQWVIPSAI